MKTYIVKDGKDEGFVVSKKKDFLSAAVKFNSPLNNWMFLWKLNLPFELLDFQPCLDVLLHSIRLLWILSNKRDISKVHRWSFAMNKDEKTRHLLNRQPNTIPVWIFQWRLIQQPGSKNCNWLVSFYFIPEKNVITILLHIFKRHIFVRDSIMFNSHGTRRLYPGPSHNEGDF